MLIPPGSYVRLASGEMGLAIKRDTDAGTSG